jgi:hypothetical protein
MMNTPPAGSAPTREQQLVRAFVDMADTLVDDYDVVELLHRLAGYCVSLLGATAAGLLLSDQRGSLQVVAASDERTRLLELLQLQADQGPCLDAYHTGVAVHADNLAAELGRWPVFVPEALAEGYRSVQAIPLRLRRQVIGALNLFGSDAVTARVSTRSPVVFWFFLVDEPTTGDLTYLSRRHALHRQLQPDLPEQTSIQALGPAGVRAEVFVPGHG